MKVKADALNTPENLKRVKEFKQKLEIYEQNEALKGKVFDPKALFTRANEIITVVDPVLGLIKYGELTFEDSFEFSEIRDRKERTVKIAYLMLKKAYPDLTEDMVRKMPLREASALMNIVLSQPCFLSRQDIPLKSGSETTGKPKE